MRSAVRPRSRAAARSEANIAKYVAQSSAGTGWGSSGDAAPGHLLDRSTGRIATRDGSADTDRGNLAQPSCDHTPPGVRRGWRARAAGSAGAPCPQRPDQAWPGQAGLEAPCLALERLRDVLPEDGTRGEPDRGRGGRD